MIKNVILLQIQIENNQLNNKSWQKKKKSHRQIHSKVQITKILSGGGKVIAEAKVEKKLIKPTQKVEKDKIEDKKAKVKKDIKK